MGWGWSNISISIKSDLLAKLLREHGITPKGAGNVKNDIRYDVDFEWEYESRYECMAQDVKSVGDLIYYYISCVLAVEQKKELKELEKAYFPNRDAIIDSVECAEYHAMVNWDVNPVHEVYSFTLAPKIKTIKKGKHIFDDPRTAPPSWNRGIHYLGNETDMSEVSGRLRANGLLWEYSMDGDYRYYFDEFGMTGRYIVVSDAVAADADAGKLSREIQDAISLREKFGTLIVRMSDLLALGPYQDPVCTHKIDTLEGKNVALIGEFSQRSNPAMKKTVTERGGIPTNRLKNYSDYMVIAAGRKIWAGDREDVVISKAEKYFKASGKPIIMSEEQYLAQIENVAKVAPQQKKPDVDPNLPTTALTGKIFVVNGFTPAAAKKLKEMIIAVGGVVRARVSKSTNYVVYNSKETAELAGVRDAKALNAEGGSISILDENEARALIESLK